MQIKGVRDGLLVTLGEGNWLHLQEGLLQHVAEKQGFFKGARVAVDVGNLSLHAKEIGVLRDRLSDQGMVLWAVLSKSPTTEKTAQLLGLATRLINSPQDCITRPSDGFLTGENAIIVRKTLRPGMKVNHTTHVVILGDVPQGAEVISDGSVVVWGFLRGLAQAGANGDEEAVVCALGLEPMRLKIAGLIALAREWKTKTGPEMAQIRKGKIEFVPWIKK